MSSRHFGLLLIVSTFFAGVCSRYTRGEKYDLMEICGRSGVQGTVSERIINGTPATPGHWPWMVGLYTAEDQFYCGGVLITSQFVLTAAHCYRDKNTEGFLSVRLGSTKRTNFTIHCQQNKDKNVHLERSDTTVIHEDLEDQVICREVDYVCVPLQENCTLFMKDIALLKLKEPVNITKYIRPICLPEHCEEPPSNASIYGVGWGRVYEFYAIDGMYYDETYESSNEGNENAISSDGGESSAKETNYASTSELGGFLIKSDPQTLMERNISLITNDQCKRQLATAVPNYALCSKGGICYGDSGGPLMYQKKGQWFLAAINSVAGGHCYNPARPAIHVMVSHFVDSLIFPFIRQYQKSESAKHNLCIDDEARKRCVTTFYDSYNMSVEDSEGDDETSE
ncbi:enteropeptidase-like [Ixodes scapularis]|uniref:enteropeptidase-like n=1 Tax=Ixodes scapularis TaxID=6945 RepID=UPI001A9D9FF1|nr:enteropeptidase-like [Ixodes scapularis]